MPPALAPAPPPYLDVNNDLYSTPIDALLVINLLHEESAEGEQGEIDATATGARELPDDGNP